MNLKMMKRIAEHSTHFRYNHAALIFSGSRLLSFGYNHEHLHAEVSAIRRLSRIYRTNNSRPAGNLHLVSFMVKKRSSCIGNSEPCMNCMKAIIEAGIKKISYFKNGRMVQRTVIKPDYSWFQGKINKQLLAEYVAGCAYN